MKKTKRSSELQGEEDDRLSELPDSVILFHILSSVPMVDVVRTTILSKRWRNLWTTTPFLNFDFDYHSRRSVDYHPWMSSRSLLYGRFQMWVNHILFRWNGVRILELKVSCDFNSLTSREMELWVEFAIAKGVENLHLHGKYGVKWWVPQCLFSCSSLKLLSIKNFPWRNDGIVQWNKLKKLNITQGFEVTEHLISQILWGSPLLEVFELSFQDQGQSLNIRSNSLKELSIYKYLLFSDDFDSEYLSLVSASELTIWTPNLETLRMKGIPFGKCGLTNVPASTCVTIEFSGLFSGLFTGQFDCVIYEDDVIDYIQGRFEQILQAIQHVESVELVCSSIKVLGVMEQEKCIYSVVKSLVVMYRCHCYDPFIGPLKLFSQLSRLVLGCNVKFMHVESCVYPGFRAANFPKSLQLRTVDITWSNSKGDDDIFPFIEFLLKYADKLEKMVFRVKETSPSTNSLLLASQKLVRMPRSSPTCTILTLPY